MKMKTVGIWIKFSYLFKKNVYQCMNCGYLADRAYPHCPRCGVLSVTPPGTARANSRDELDWIEEAECIAAALDDRD